MKGRTLFLIVGVVAVLACLVCVAVGLITTSSPSYQATATARAAAGAMRGTSPPGATARAVASATRAPSPTRTARVTLASTPTAVELSEAEAKGLVECDISGDGLEWIKVILESMSPDPLEVTILPGTIFEAHSVGTQSMVVREKRAALLESRGSKKSLTLRAACANMRLGVPDEEDTFTMSKTPTSEDLIKLLSLPDFLKETFRVQQFAIWTITDNPTRDRYVGIGAFGFGSGPDDKEIGKIRTLFEKAGIPIDKYQALR